MFFFSLQLAPVRQVWLQHWRPLLRAAHPLGREALRPSRDLQQHGFVGQVCGCSGELQVSTSQALISIDPDEKKLWVHPVLHNLYGAVFYQPRGRLKSDIYFSVCRFGWMAVLTFCLIFHLFVRRKYRIIYRCLCATRKTALVFAVFALLLKLISSCNILDKKVEQQVRFVLWCQLSRTVHLILRVEACIYR